MHTLATTSQRTSRCCLHTNLVVNKDLATLHCTGRCEFFDYSKPCLPAAYLGLSVIIVIRFVVVTICLFEIITYHRVATALGRSAIVGVVIFRSSEPLRVSHGVL